MGKSLLSFITNSKECLHFFLPNYQRTTFISLIVLLTMLCDYTLSQGVISFFNEGTSSASESCRFSPDVEGTCQQIHHCPKVVQNLRQTSPKLCGWSGTIPKVCCPGPSLAAIDSCAPSTPIGPSSFRRTVRQASLLPILLTPRPTTNFPDFLANSVKPLVVEGTNSVQNSRPWMAAILDKGFGNVLDRLFCGGSLIGTRHILTAAHCFHSRALDVKQFEVLLGSNNLSLAILHNVDQILLHPEYRDPTWYNDIAIMRLSREIRFTPSVRAICLPPPSAKSIKFRSSVGIVAGWGLTKFGGELSEYLQEASLPVVPNENCNSTFLSLRGTIRRYPQGITNTLICAAAPITANKTQDACSGDSGGPLFLSDDASQRWIQIGVVSSGFQCALPGVPGIYTRVTSYLDWILLNMK